MAKEVRFCGGSLDDLRAFPQSARRAAGYQIDKVQHGEEPGDWKPMPTIGKGVCEIRIRDEAGAFRIVYFARLAEAVYILHCFQKKTPRTSRRDIDLASERYRAVMKERGK